MTTALLSLSLTAFFKLSRIRAFAKLRRSLSLIALPTLLFLMLKLDRIFRGFCRFYTPAYEALRELVGLGFIRLLPVYEKPVRVKPTVPLVIGPFVKLSFYCVEESSFVIVKFWTYGFFLEFLERAEYPTELFSESLFGVY